MGILKKKKMWYSFILLLVFFLQHIIMIIIIAEDSYDCPSSTCNNLEIRFPFRLKYRQPEKCGYPGFELSCTKKNETVIRITDPGSCLVRRLLNFSLSSDSPFRRTTEVYNYNYTIFNCSSPDHFYGSTIPCRSSSSSIVAYPSDDSSISLGDFDPDKCKQVGTILASYHYQFSLLLLNWDKPKCGKCESDGRKCGYINYSTTSLAIGCLGTLPPPSLHPKGESHKKIAKGESQKKIAIGESQKKIAIGVSLCIFVCSVVSVVVVIRVRRKQRNTEEKGYQLDIENFLENHEGLKRTRYTYAEIKRITNKFNRKLGQGGYGTVFEGKLRNGAKVAVKVLNKTQGNGEEFINEVATIGRIHHTNIVQLLGFCADGDERALIYEFMPNLSLDKYIFSRDDRKQYLGWGKLQGIAIGTARGIEYLHQGCDQRILHFDIKPHNILLDKKFNPKISDFGLAKLSSKGESNVPMTAARGTMGYIAPEMFSREFGNVSSKSDVYSFGMLLLEMVGGRKNTEVKVEKASQIYFPEWIYYRLDKGEDLGIQLDDIEEDETIAKKLTMVSLWCVQWHPADRPSMKSVIQMLEGSFENLIMPPNPFRSTAPTSSSTTNIPDMTPKKELTFILEESK